MQVYPVVVYKDPKSDYGTEVPDFPGCYSAGSTLSEALEETREAIDTHLEGMAKDGEVAPEPSDLSTIQATGDYAARSPNALDEAKLATSVRYEVLKQKDCLAMR